MPTWNGRPCGDHSRNRSVQRGLGLRRVVPREPPQVATLVWPEPLAHEDDSLDLIECRAQLDAFDEGRADLLVHPCPCSSPAGRPLLWDALPESAVLRTQTRNWPLSCN